MNGSGSISGRSRRTGSVLKWAALALVAAPAVASAGKPPPPPPPATPQEVKNQFFDWHVNDTPNYLPSPFLTDQSANAVNAFLKKLPANQPKAIKIEVPISNATANLIFNNPAYRISYVLGDVESANPNVKMKTIAEQVRFVNGQNNGTKTKSYNAFIGNYGFTKLANDVTDPNNYGSQQGQHSYSGWGIGAYNSAKLNMSMPELYSGSGSFKNPAAKNSTAPNIRSSMFTLPALRVSQIEVNTNSNERIVPWVARFNNFGNGFMDTDRNAANGFKFETGKAMPAANGRPFVSASDTKDQLLSRRDFATLMAHYRMRGADSFVLFESGVVGYSNEQKRLDAQAGWTLPQIDKVFKAADFELVLGKDSDYKNGKNEKDYNGNIIIDGKEKTIEAAGAMFSGVYSLSLKTLDIMLSNMDDEDHTLTLPKSIGGYALKTTSFKVDDGSHLLIEYKLTTSGINKGWSLTSSSISTPFKDLSNDRNGVGIPEPTTLTVTAALMGFLMITPRRRRRPAAAGTEQ